MNISIRRLLSPVAATALALGALTACGPDESAEFDVEDDQQAATQDEQTEDEDPADDSGESDDLDEAADDAAEETEDDAADPTETDTDNDDTDNDTDNDTDPSDTDSDSALNSRTLDPADAIETTTYDLSEADDRDEATVTVGVHSVQVDGDVMVLELSFTPEFQGDGTYNIFNMNSQSGLRPSLNDRENLKQYNVLGGLSDPWATEVGTSGLQASSGETLAYWAYFAAPEDEIDSIAVSVIGGAVEFNDVPIER